MKNKFSNSNIKTLILALIIILIGYVLTNFIYNGLIVSTSEVRRGEKNISGNELSSISDVSELNISPWNMYANNNVDKRPLKNEYAIDNDYKGYIANLLADLIKENDMEVKEEQDLIKSIYCVDFGKAIDTLMDNKNIFLFNNQIESKDENKIYDVKFSFGNMDEVSFSVKEKGIIQKVEEKKLKVQHKELTELARNTGQKVEDYLLNIQKVINEENKFYNWSIVIDSILNKNSDYDYSVYRDVFATDSDLVVMYVIENRYILYLYYDPVKEEFFGFNFQYK